MNGRYLKKFRKNDSKKFPLKRSMMGSDLADDDEILHIKSRDWRACPPTWTVSTRDRPTFAVYLEEEIPWKILRVYLKDKRKRTAIADLHWPTGQQMETGAKHSHSKWAHKVLLENDICPQYKMDRRDSSWVLDDDSLRSVQEVSGYKITYNGIKSINEVPEPFTTWRQPWL